MIPVRTVIADNELGLLYRDRKLRRVLTPGVNRYFAFRTRLVRIRMDAYPVVSEQLVLLNKTDPETVARYFAVAETGDSELALVFARGGMGGRLVDIVGPGSTAFYGKTLAPIEIRVVDAARDVELEAGLVPAIERAGKSKLVTVVTVPQGFVGLLAVDGVRQRELTAGRYAFVTAVRRVTVDFYDLRLQTLEVTGQEVLTRDRIGVRANLTAIFRITDAGRVADATAKLEDYLYKELQFALREVTGARTLEDVLGDKPGINQALRERLEPVLQAAGMKLETAGVKDIILPGDVRELMNRVIEAEKTAQANVIKRREETAATRALLNTARLMEDNPVLLRLKEVEALEKVADKIGTITVANGMDGVLTDLVRLKPRDA